MSEAPPNRSEPRPAREAACIADLARTYVSVGVVLLVSLTIASVAGVGIVLVGGLADARVRLETDLEAQRDLSVRTLRAVEQVQGELDIIERAFELDSLQ